MTNNGVRISFIIDVANDNTRVRFVNADVGEQGLAVLDPNTCDHGVGGT